MGIMASGSESLRLGENDGVWPPARCLRLGEENMTASISLIPLSTSQESSYPSLKKGGES
jgi:hypothetical protein